MLPTYSYRVSGPIHSVLFQPATQESVVLFNQTCATYTRGRKRERFSLAMVEEGEQGGETEDRDNDVFKLLFASDHDVYVGVCRNSLKVRS